MPRIRNGVRPVELPRECFGKEWLQLGSEAKQELRRDALVVCAAAPVEAVHCLRHFPARHCGWCPPCLFRARCSRGSLTGCERMLGGVQPQEPASPLSRRHQAPTLGVNQRGVGAQAAETPPAAAATRQRPSSWEAHIPSAVVVPCARGVPTGTRAAMRRCGAVLLRVALLRNSKMAAAAQREPPSRG